MREVIFKEVGMENFGPYIDPMILEFPNNSLTLMTGPNGIGKTMTMDAIPFSLYGTTSKGARGDDVVNNTIGRNCHTWISFSILQGDAIADEYRVDRYHKYTKLGNTVTISKNGEDPYKKGHKEVLPEIERLLCPKKSFMNTLMFGQKVKDFFTDLVDSDKKEIFRKILNLDRYQLFYNEAKRILDELKDKILDYEKRITVHVELLKDSDEQLVILNKQKQEYNTERDKAIKDLEKSLESSERMLNQWQQKLEGLLASQEDWKQLEKKLLELKAEEGVMNNESEAYQESLKTQVALKKAQLNTDVSEAKEKIKEEGHISKEEKKDYFMKIIEKLNSEIKTILEEKNKIDLLINTCQDNANHAEFQIGELAGGLNESTCPTCLQEITQECIDVLESKIAEFNDTIDKAKKTIDMNLTPERKKIFEKIEKINTKKEQAQEIMDVDVKDIDLFVAQKILNATGKLNAAIEKVDELAVVHSLQIKKSYQEKMIPVSDEQEKLALQAQTHQTVDTEIDDTKMSITSLERSMIQKSLDLKAKDGADFDDSQILSYEKKKRVLLVGYELLNKEMSVALEDVELYQFWKDAFSPKGIPSMLIDESIPFMNIKVSEYLEKLTNGRYLVSFDTLAETKGGEFRDKISVHVLDTQTRASSRIQLSGGQTRIIDIATILTLGDLQSNIQDIKFNILLFDEIFDSLDEENIGFVSKVLSNMKVGKSIYLISHRHEDQLEADEILTLR
jgi:DNA repair exonuclease SbcCD ATPase subunit